MVNQNEKTYLFAGHKQAVSSLESALYIVATPIGSLKDITIRALEVLAAADSILCEDTRQSGKLLQAYGIKAKLYAYHDHNGEEMRPIILEKLAEGLSLALISDAGTPLIADPGFKLVRDVKQAGFKVIPIAGASAVITALSASGLPTDSFLFDGFLPSKQQARRQRLEVLKPLQATLVFYESPQRIEDCVKDALEVLGEREAVLAREVTKLYEEFITGSLQEIYDNLKANPRKGEMVLMIAPPKEQAVTDESVDQMLKTALKSHSVKEAANLVAEASNRPKRELYQRALELKNLELKNEEP